MDSCSRSYHARRLHRPSYVMRAGPQIMSSDVNIALNNRLMLVFFIPEIISGPVDVSCRNILETIVVVLPNAVSRLTNPKGSI
jgi:hypothetical protein